MASTESATDPDVNGFAVTFRQLETPHAPLTQSTYLRLGTYIDEESTGRSETALLPKLTTTASQTASNHGILLYTNRDLQENVLGFARMQYGKGHNVEVQRDNAVYRVANGRYDVSAKQGVTISAGERDADGNIVTVADITINARGDISQTANGEVVRTTEGKKIEKTFLTTATVAEAGSLVTQFIANNHITMLSRNRVVIGSSQSVVGGISFQHQKGAHYRLHRGVTVEFAMGGRIDASKAGSIIRGLKGRSERVYGTKSAKAAGLRSIEATKDLLMSSTHHVNKAYNMNRSGIEVSDNASTQRNISPKYIYTTRALMNDEDTANRIGNFDNYYHVTWGNMMTKSKAVIDKTSLSVWRATGMNAF